VWATPDIDLTAVARRVAYSLSWLTSRVNHPYELPREPLSPLQEIYALRIAMAAVLFAVAHEMAHVSAGEIRREPNIKKSRDREYAADMWALERVLALGERDPAWPLGRTLPALGIYFFTQAMRGAFAEIEPSPQSTHPQPIDRALALNKRIVTIPDRETVGLFAGVAQVFGALFPHVQARSTYQLAPPGEVRRVLGEVIDEIPDIVGDDILLTWQSTYSLATEGYLVQLADTRTGPLTQKDVAPLEVWLGRVPGPVLDTLGAAYDGTLFARDDPRRPLVRGLATEMVPLFGDPYVREAIKTG